jgi:hypothetical protein
VVRGAPRGQVLSLHADTEGCNPYREAVSSNVALYRGCRPVRLGGWAAEDRIISPDYRGYTARDRSAAPDPAVGGWTLLQPRDIRTLTVARASSARHSGSWRPRAAPHHPSDAAQHANRNQSRFGGGGVRHISAGTAYPARQTNPVLPASAPGAVRAHLRPLSHRRAVTSEHDKSKNDNTMAEDDDVRAPRDTRIIRDWIQTREGIPRPAAQSGAHPPVGRTEAVRHRIAQKIGGCSSERKP